jgi:5-methylcytosine-specific restriction enzyme subunit McrC
MHRLGVSARAPSRIETAADRIGHHDRVDRRMLDAAHLLRDMAIPVHQLGTRTMPRLRQDDRLYRRLFEDAVRGYFRHKLGPHGWTVQRTRQYWSHQPDDSGAGYLPVMNTDTVICPPDHSTRIVVETKFTDALTESHYGTTVIKPEYMYQLHAYLMSQSAAEGADRAKRVAGSLTTTRNSSRYSARQYMS